MGQLVLAHRHDIGLIQHDIGGHQNGVSDQPVVDVLRLHPGLLFEGRHTQKPTQRSDHSQVGEQLGNLGHVGLHEDDGLFRIDARRQPVERHLKDVLLQLGGVLEVVSACISTMQ